MKIVAIGDSITVGYPFTNHESWVEHLSQEVKGHVLNQGICGDLTSGMRKRFHRDVINHAPTHAIILGGANDAYEKIYLKSVCANFMAMDDFYSAFLNRITADQGAQLFVDEIHPSIEGYALMGEVAVRSYLAKIDVVRAE